MNATYRETPTPSSIGQARNIWLWQAVMISILICILIASLHYQQRQTLNQTVAALDSISQARIDLSEGFLHTTLAGDPALPFDREQGLALLSQAIASFETSATKLEPQDQSIVTFRGDVQVFRDQLKTWRSTATLSAMSSRASS